MYVNDLPSSVEATVKMFGGDKKLDSKTNSHFQNIAFNDIKTFQRVQMCLAWVVTRSPRSMSLLKSPHWFPVPYHIIFLRCVLFLTRHFLVSNHRIYIHCLLL